MQILRPFPFGEKRRKEKGEISEETRAMTRRGNRWTAAQVIAHQKKRGDKVTVERFDLADVVAKDLEIWPGLDLPAQPVRELKFHPTRRWRFDLAWPDIMLAVEIHGGTRSQGGKQRSHAGYGGMQRDHEKLRAATLSGWLVLVYTDQDMKDGKDSMYAEICDALNRRMHGELGNFDAWRPE